MAGRLTHRLPRGRRLAVALAVVLLVSAGHWWVGGRLLDSRLGWGADETPVARMDVAFVRELTPTAAPPAVPAPPAPRRSPRAAVSAPGASAPRSEPPPDRAPEPPVVPEPSPVSEAPALDTEPPAPEIPAAQSPLPLSEAASAVAQTHSDSAAYDWLPPSTQLSYSLRGDVNGPVEGWAEVRWVRQGARYQVQIDTRVALVATRRLTSDGELGPAGLVPRRYDEETEMLLSSPRRNAVRFEDDAVVLADGSRRGRPAGVQDTASQLVQMVWLFTTSPRRLSPGERIELPLALPRRLDTWVYDVQPPETLYTPFGEIQAYAVRPRKPERATNVLTVQSWFAPSLQYLPVKLRIEQSERVYVELMLDRLPMQAAPAVSPTP